MPLKDVKNEQLEWVVVQLTSLAEREKCLRTIKISAKKILGKDVEVYIPALSENVRGDEETTFYMEGYVFIKYQDGVNYSKLNETANFRNVLCSRDRTGRVSYDTVKDSVLRPVRKGVKDMSKVTFRVGDNVKVIKGSCKNLSGSIIVVYDKERVQVDASMRTKPLLLDFPCSFLEKIPD